jgi:hypothetical protein
LFVLPKLLSCASRRFEAGLLLGVPAGPAKRVADIAIIALAMKPSFRFVRKLG